jgi:3-isopropylmalate/(R)-2-methylmalate dehydratase small subunit
MLPAMEKPPLSPESETYTQMNTITGTVATLKENEKLDVVLMGNDNCTVLVADGKIGNDNTNKSLVETFQKSGLVCVIAGSFRRDFFRQAINNGLALLTINLIDKVNNGDSITIDLAGGKIILKDEKITFPPYPEQVLDIISCGSLLKAVKKELGKEE